MTGHCKFDREFGTQKRRSSGCHHDTNCSIDAESVEAKIMELLTDYTLSSFDYK